MSHNAAHTEPDVAVLPPTAGPALEAAFGRGAPDFVLRDAAILPHEVKAVVCGPTTGDPCYPLRLGNPANSCSGEVAGPWCLTWTGAAPGFAPAVRAALAQSANPWKGATVTTPPGLPPGLLTQALGIAVVAPLLAGLVIGILVRVIRRRRLLGVWSAAGLAAAVFGGVTLAGFVTMRIGLGDHLSGGLIAAAVACAVAHQTGARRMPYVFGILGLVAAALILEGASRTLPYLPPVFPPLAELSTTLDEREHHQAAVRLHGSSGHALCMALELGLARLPNTRLVRPTDPRPRVLHLGDSMTYGSFVATSETFVSQLAQHEPTVNHLNGAWPGTSIDSQLALARQLLPVLKPSRVVVHVFPGNDLDEVGRPFPCSSDGPLFDSSRTPPQPRYLPPHWVSPHGMAHWYAAHSPPPLLLRLATPWSLAARHLAGLYVRATLLLGGPPSLSRTEAIAQYELLLGALQVDTQQAGAELVLAILPIRQLAGGQAQITWPAEVAARLGIVAVEAPSSLHEPAPAHANGGRYIDEPPGDVHLAPAGHRLYADRLREKLQALAPSATPPTKLAP